MIFPRFHWLALSGLLFAVVAVQGAPALAEDTLSPSSLACDSRGRALYVGCGTAAKVLELDPATRQVRRTIPVPGPVSGLVLSSDGNSLIVTCAAPVSTICIIDTRLGALLVKIPAGHHAAAPVLSSDNRTLFVCNRFTHDVSVFDLALGRERQRVRVRREPVSAALTADGRHLLVANLLHDGRADVAGVSAVISVIDVGLGKVVKELSLPDGGGLSADLRVSPDGRHAALAHLIGRYHHPATQVERGWINTNALTIVDLTELEIVDTFLLDGPDRGAANPWGVAWSPDGGQLLVTHAGVHEISVIDAPGVLAKLAARSAAARQGGLPPSRDLAFLATHRQRIALPDGELGPRAVAVVNGEAWVANYFSDSLAVFDLGELARPVETVRLAPRGERDPARLGEFHFNNAKLCVQGWQSCASCHPGNGRVDALNWDQMNDGLGNPKNNRSLLLSFKMSPVMSLGVRADSRTAVRAGVRHAMFTTQPDEIAESIDAYLESLRPVPSPHLAAGGLSPAARRGEKLFHHQDVGCAECHPRGDFTDMKRYDVGTRGLLDRAGDTFYTPTLVEVWRTAPYLHDGSAATMLEVLTTRNSGDQHGRTSQLSTAEISDLLEYVMSL